MGRFSSFERISKDKYDTVDSRAVPPLLDHVVGGSFVEPCAGKGCLMDMLIRHGMTCVYACDIEPDGFGIDQKDALELEGIKHQIITNPPWTRKILHEMIDHFRSLEVDSWLLFDAGWMFTEQAAPYLKYCHKIIVVPRLQWFPGTKFSAIDDCAWYLFRPTKGDTILINERGR